MYLLDTNTVTYFFKGMGRVGERMLAARPSEIALPAIVLYEIEVGLAKSPKAKRRRAQLEELIASITVLPFGGREARASGQVRAKLERRGTPIGPLDTLIAGTAIANGVTLITHNVDEFSRVEGLMWEDWF